MSRRGAPPISQSDLSDPVTPDRVDRIWEQIEADLSVPETSTSTSPRLIGVFAAVAASLAGGLLLGKLIWEQPAAPEVTATPAVASACPDAPTGIFAAGTREQAFDLPGGGRLVLSPGATVEVVRQQGDSLELRLVRGEATVNAADSPPQKLVAVLAGEATLSTQGGGVVRVRRNTHDLDVSVARGHVSVRSPDGDRSLVKGQHARAIPLRSIRPTARLTAPAARGSARVPPEGKPDAVEEIPAPAPPLADWRTKSRAGDVQEALRLLQERPGGIDGAIQGAGDADTLWEIHDVSIRQDPSAAYRALTRVAEAFPNDASAHLAAYKLGNYYRRAGQHEQANKWFARAAESAEGVLAEDALCNQFRNALNEEEALRFAQEYLAKYPDGRCKQEAERRVAGEDSSDDEEVSPDEEPSPALEGEADAAVPE